MQAGRLGAGSDDVGTGVGSLKRLTVEWPVLPQSGGPCVISGSDKQLTDVDVNKSNSLSVVGSCWEWMLNVVVLGGKFQKTCSFW